MSTQHTPGPWTRTPDQRFKHDNSAGIKGPSGTYVACALDFNRYDRDAEVEANARLIAAAPDLFKALLVQEAAEANDRGEDIYDLMIHQLKESDKWLSGDDLHEWAKELRTAALAKAKGQPAHTTPVSILGDKSE